MSRISGTLAALKQQGRKALIPYITAGDPQPAWTVELMHALSGMHVCWAFRDPVFERDCLELSTKALEYAALRVPVLLARSAGNESVFGADYPLFADSAAQAAQLLKRLAEDAAFRDAAVNALARVAGRFEFPAVRASLRSSGVLPAVS